MKGVCKLCLKEKKLIKRSHIFPNFMYRGMSDEKGRMYVLSSERPLKPKVAQSGSHEKYIFCADCDNRILGQLEGFASNQLYNKPFKISSVDFGHIKVGPDAVIIQCNDIAYKEFKLFLFSLLWRASISTEPLFENFKLPAGEEEFLRSAIYEGAVVDESAFPCIVAACISNEVETDFVAVDPFKKGIVKFYVNEFLYTFYLEQNSWDETTTHLAIGMDDPMRIMAFSPQRWLEIRKTIVSAAVKASKKNF
jgi:hypothetical protein